MKYVHLSNIFLIILSFGQYISGIRPYTVFLFLIFKFISSYKSIGFQKENLLRAILSITYLLFGFILVLLDGEISIPKIRSFIFWFLPLILVVPFFIFRMKIDINLLKICFLFGIIFFLAEFLAYNIIQILPSQIFGDKYYSQVVYGLVRPYGASGHPGASGATLCLLGIILGIETKNKIYFLASILCVLISLSGTSFISLVAFLLIPNRWIKLSIIVLSIFLLLEDFETTVTLDKFSRGYIEHIISSKYFQISETLRLAFNEKMNFEFNTMGDNTIVSAIKSLGLFGFLWLCFGIVSIITFSKSFVFSATCVLVSLHYPLLWAGLGLLLFITIYNGISDEKNRQNILP